MSHYEYGSNTKDRYRPKRRRIALGNGFIGRYDKIPDIFPPFLLKIPTKWD
jgi:hypothetical protein